MYCTMGCFSSITCFLWFTKSLEGKAGYQSQVFAQLKHRERDSHLWTLQSHKLTWSEQQGGNWNTGNPKKLSDANHLYYHATHAQEKRIFNLWKSILIKSGVVFCFHCFHTGILMSILMWVTFHWHSLLWRDLNICVHAPHPGSHFIDCWKRSLTSLIKQH